VLGSALGDDTNPVARLAAHGSGRELPWGVVVTARGGQGDHRSQEEHTDSPSDEHIRDLHARVMGSMPVSTPEG